MRFAIKEQKVLVPIRVIIMTRIGGPNRNCTCDPRVISTVLY